MNAKKALAAGSILAIAVALSAILALQDNPAAAETMNDDGTLVSLQTDTPEEGFQLALALSRKGVTETQPDTDILHAQRPKYSHDADALIAASHVVAVHFQTIAEANNHWRE